MTASARKLRLLMRKVPMPVVVVTLNTAAASASATLLKPIKPYNGTIHLNSNLSETHHLRGLTCSSFTSVSLNPPIISFAVASGSSFIPSLSAAPKFAVNLLSQSQVQESTTFSSKTKDFAKVPYVIDQSGVPILPESIGSLVCSLHSTVQVGDHNVCFGAVEQVNEGEGLPLVYYRSGYRSVGDEVFIDAFRNQRLSFRDWTHRAHLR